MPPFETLIKRDWKSYTPSEQRLASFFIDHLQELPFETAASIAKRVEVSAMTVGRFLRKLGYTDLRDVKDELRASSESRVDETAAGVFTPPTLKVRLEGMRDLHKIPESVDWPPIVSMIATASTVRVASFHVGRFLGLGFATFLSNLRAGVTFSDGADGGYGEILLDPNPDSLLILIDFRRYSRHFRLLAEEAAARKLRTIILTDVYCHWARALTPHVLMIETDFGIRSLSMAQLLFELLLAAVANELKDADARLEQLHDLREKFVGFVPTEGVRRPRGERGESSG